VITRDEYMMGRDVSHALECSPAILRNAERTVEIVSKMLILAKGAGVPITSRPDGTLINSGWRPPSLNAATPGAATRSLHMTGEACDLYDPKGHLATWAEISASTVLRDLGLWMEAPAKTKGWLHVQTKPPRSGNRVFWP
jgi:hypothetical protein